MINLESNRIVRGKNWLLYWWYGYDLFDRSFSERDVDLL